MWISRVRPTTSESGPMNSSDTARAAVGSDITSVLWVGETPNASTNSGSSAWTSYNSTNVAMPAANSATRTRR
jgi:hypothetical protein